MTAASLHSNEFYLKMKSEITRPDSLTNIRRQTTECQISTNAYERTHIYGPCGLDSLIQLSIISNCSILPRLSLTAIRYIFILLSAAITDLLQSVVLYKVE